MPWTGPATTLTLILATVISWFHAWYVWRNRAAQPASGFIGLMITTGFWSLASALVALSGQRPEAHFWYRVMGALVPYFSVGIFVTCAQYVDYAPINRRRVIGLLLVIPTLSALLSLTGDFHTLYTFDVKFQYHDQYIVSFTSTTGPWFIIHAAYSYILVMVGMFMLIQRIGSTRFTAYRWQAVLMLLGISFPFIASLYNTFFVAEITFLPQFVVIVSAPLVFWALFRYRLFSLHPIARDQAFEDMDDAVLVIDTNNRLVDINPAAERFIGQVGAGVVGLPVTAAFAGSFPHLDQWLDDEQAQTQFEIGSGDEQRSFDLRITPLNRSRTSIGKLIVIRDSTEQQRAER
ncbi:MAG: PAS domain-containing protein, partial [Anaerolineae bacterium]|nr:PAS domain-containing protein [Anaerolineae bacterium]